MSSWRNKKNIMWIPPVIQSYEFDQIIGYLMMCLKKKWLNDGVGRNPMPHSAVSDLGLC